MTEKLEEMEMLKGENEKPDVESHPPPAKKRRHTEKARRTKLVTTTEDPCSSHKEVWYYLGSRFRL